MAVNLSPVGGVAAQFFTSTGAVLTGGKLYTYAAGTTTPAVTYTTSQGNIPWTNPVVLDAAGRVPGSGEIWLTDGVIYKFVLKDSNDVLIATYDNITGINSNSVAYTNQQEIVTATAGQTVFNLGISYQPGTNSLSVFVDGVNQYGPGASYSYVETDSTTVTFNSGLHVGAEVKFTTTQQQGAGAVSASQVSYTAEGSGAVTTNVQTKLREIISVKDFGATGDGVTDDSDAIRLAAMAAAGKSLYFPSGTYLMSFTLASAVAMIPVYNDSEYYGDGPSSVIKIKTGSVQPGFNAYSTIFWADNVHNVNIHDLYLDGNESNITHASESPPLIYVTGGSYNVQITRNTLARPGGDCVIVGSGGAVSLGGEKVVITENIAISPARSCYVLTSARDVIIANNLGYDAANSYIDIETDVAGTYVGNVTITGNVFRSTSGNKGTGFAATGPGTQFDIVVTNNVFASTDFVASLGSALNDGIIFSNNTGSGAPTTGNKFLIEIVGGLKNGQICNNKLTAQTTGVGGIWCRGPYRVNIEGNTISGVGYSGSIVVDDPYGLQPANVKIRDNAIYNLQSGVTSGISVATGITTVIAGNFVDAGSLAINAIVAGSENSVVSSNTVTSSANTGSGVYVFGANSVIENNTITKFDNGIYLTDSTHYCRVSKNTVNGSNIGVYAYKTNYSNISDNFVTNSNNDGVQITSGAGSTVVQGNTITNSSKSGAGSYYGLALYQSNITVTDNVITDTQVSKTQNYAIRGVGGTDYFTFTGNNLSGNGTGAFSNISGSNYYPNITGTFATDMAKFNRLT